MGNWFISSTGEGLSLTIKSGIVSIIPMIITVLNMIGVQATQSDLVNAVNEISAGVAAIMFLYGLGRKVYLNIVK